MKRRGFKRKLRNGLLYLTLVLAGIIFVMASVQLVFSNAFGTLALALSGGYIVTFCTVNDIEI